MKALDALTLGVQDQTLPWLRYSKALIQNKYSSQRIFKRQLKNFPLSVQTTQHVADHSLPKEDALNIKIVATRLSYQNEYKYKITTHNTDNNITTHTHTKTKQPRPKCL